MFWQGDQRTGLLLKRWGYLALAVAGSVYAAVVLVAVGAGGWMVAAAVGGFSVACALMVRRISRLVRELIP